MTTASSADIDSGDLLQALAFAQRCFDHWHEIGLVRDAPPYANLRENLEAGNPIPDDVQLRSGDVCWSCKRAVAPDATCRDECGAPVQTPDVQKLRYLIFMCFEIKRLCASGRLTLSEADGCLADANARIAALRRKLDGERIPMAVPVQSRTAT